MSTTTGQHAITVSDTQQKEGIRAVVSRVSKRKLFVAKGLSARVPTTGHRCAIRRGILEKAPYASIPSAGSVYDDLVLFLHAFTPLITFGFNL